MLCECTSPNNFVFAGAKLQQIFDINKFFVMKSKIFAQILQIVAEVTELSEEEILSKVKTDDLVAARSLFVHYSAMLGVPSISIARFLRRSNTHSVNRYLSDYQSFIKSSYLFRQMDGRISSALKPYLSR